MAMRKTTSVIVAALALSLPCLAQEWELGVAGGYRLDANPSISGPTGSVQPGFASGGVAGVVFGNDMYEHIGGEFRYMFQFGGPQLQSQGAKVSAAGYANVTVYELLFHAAPREARIRPFVAAGAGIKIYTSSARSAQPAPNSALLTQGTQVEPAISIGAGLKYRFYKHNLLRLDLRAQMTPCPDQIFKPTGGSRVHGWVYSFVPLGGISYVF
jgi:hypothetical protein